MISLPDFKEKQILFIKTSTNCENKIRILNDNVVFEKDGKIENRISCLRVFSIFIIGNFSLTSELIRKGIKYGISFFLLKNNFDCYASINSIAEGNYLLREKQYFILPQEELLISKKLVLNKIENQYRLLKLKNKNIHKDKDIDKIKKIIINSKNLDFLRGIEGNFSKDFFNIYFKEIGWQSRLPRVKPDIPNFLLDMGYSMLFNFINSLLNLFGFDTYKGFYHKLFFQRKSLSCDLIEPFRPIIDKEVLKIFNLKIIKNNDFKFKNDEVAISYKKTSKYTLIFLEAIMKRKEEIYLYIRNFYHFLMDSQKYSFPYFKI